MALNPPAEQAVWFVEDTGAVLVTLASEHIGKAFDIARTLQVRFFYRIIGRDMLQDVPIWGVWDTCDAGKPSWQRPWKTFSCTTDDPVVMWCISQRSV